MNKHDVAVVAEAKASLVIAEVRIKFANELFSVYQKDAHGRLSLLATFGTLAAAQAAFPGATLDPSATSADASVKSMFLSLVRSPTAWSCSLGLVSIGVWFTFIGEGSQLPLLLPLIMLPLIGIVLGVRAISRGRKTGGVVGVVLCVAGGFPTLISAVEAGLAVG